MSDLDYRSWTLFVVLVLSNIASITIDYGQRDEIQQLREQVWVLEEDMYIQQNGQTFKDALTPERN